MWIHKEERYVLGSAKSGSISERHWLQDMEQQTRQTVFQLRFVQRRSAGQHQKPVETSHYIQCMRARARHHHLRLGLLCHQEQSLGVLQLHHPEEEDRNENTLHSNLINIEPYMLFLNCVKKNVSMYYWGMPRFYRTLSLKDKTFFVIDYNRENLYHTIIFFSFVL